MTKGVPKERCTDDMVDGAVEYILDLFAETYTDLLDKHPEKQREVFLAIARKGKERKGKERQKAMAAS